jgi:uncharacterized membrane protein
MTEEWRWIALVLSASIVGGYELRLARVARRDPSRTARTAHSALRGEWVRALSKQSGSEILAVQALRNSLMSATIMASTAALVLMGAFNMLGSHRDTSYLADRLVTARHVLEAGLVLTLFAAFVCSATAMRYYHHAGFAMSLPVASTERSAREPLAVTYVQRGGALYSWSLRCFFYAAPITVGLLSPFLMPIAAAGLVLVLSVFDGAPRRIDS